MKRNLMPLRTAYSFFAANMQQNGYREYMSFREWTAQIIRCNGADALQNLANNYNSFFK